MRYPDAPGFKGDTETGREAALQLLPKLGRRQQEVLDALSAGPATPEEIADRTGRHFSVVRPRVSELKAKHLVIDDGTRGKGALGGKVVRVRLTSLEEREALTDGAGGSDD
jgi:DNA-binding IclR family transcriptional regulator